MSSVLPKNANAGLDLAGRGGEVLRFYGDGEVPTSFPGLFPFSWGRSPHEEGKSPGNEVGEVRMGS